MLSHKFQHSTLQLSCLKVFRTTHHRHQQPFGQEVAISIRKTVLWIGIIFGQTTEPIGCSTYRWNNPVLMFDMSRKGFEALVCDY